MQRVTFPVRRKADEVHIAADRLTWNRIASTLHEQAPNEGCTFVLTRPSVGCLRTTVILKEPIWPGPKDLIATPGGLEISSDYISKAIDAAIDAGSLVGLALIHT